MWRELFSALILTREPAYSIFWSGTCSRLTCAGHARVARLVSHFSPHLFRSRKESAVKPFLTYLRSTSPPVRRWSALLSFLVCISNSVPMARAAITFTNNTLIDTSDLTYEGQDVVINACTVTANGRHAFNSVSLLNAAVLTHQATTISNEYSLVLTVANNLLVDATSS